MPRNSIPILIAGIAALMAVIGLIVSGGPSVGKAEKRDQARLDDLIALRDLTHCIAEVSGGVLPASIDGTDLCPSAIAFTDPYTGDDYRYEWVSARGFKLCAPFEYPERISLAGAASLDPSTGCIQFTYRP